MLTTTAILIGLLLLVTLNNVMDKKVKDGTDIVAMLIVLASEGVVVYQFYFVMLPACWN